MTHDELKQLSAYSRYDGFYLAILWVASFACLLYSSSLPILGQFYTILLFSTPFFVAYRFKKFREEGRNGVISSSSLQCGTYLQPSSMVVYELCRQRKVVIDPYNCLFHTTSETDVYNHERILQ